MVCPRQSWKNHLQEAKQIPSNICKSEENERKIVSAQFGLAFLVRLVTPRGSSSKGVEMHHAADKKGGLRICLVAKLLQGHAGTTEPHLCVHQESWNCICPE